jgi:hypothetical protein
MNSGRTMFKTAAMGKTATYYRYGSRNQNTKNAFVRSLIKSALVIGGLCVLWIYINA